MLKGLFGDVELDVVTRNYREFGLNKAFSVYGKYRCEAKWYFRYMTLNCISIANPCRQRGWNRKWYFWCSTVFTILPAELVLQVFAGSSPLDENGIFGN